MNSNSRLVVIILVLAAAAAGGFLWWRRSRSVPPAPAPVVAPVAVPKSPPVPAPAPAAAQPAIRYPIERVAPPAAGESSDAYISNVLVGLLGKKAVLSFLLTDDFAHRIVATVNNLATDEAGSELWPVRRTPGRFQTDQGADSGTATIAAANAQRYAAFVRLVEGVDTQRAAAAYVRIYPLLQQAYEDLGFTGKYFNDRVVEVIDHLLATPQLSAPPAVKRVQAAGVTPAAAATGDDLYVFADPALEARSTGQKTLLRLGPQNAAKLKAKLADLRGQLARGR